MSYPINLSVTGKPSPRTDHPASAGRRRTPMTANKAKNQKSNIFCFGNNDVLEAQTDNNSRQKQKSGGVISKSELESIKVLTNRDIEQNDKRNVQVAAFRSPRKIAPKGVPKLSLDDVVGKDNDNVYTRLPTAAPNLNSPTSLDSISWGTPVKILQQKPSKGGGWQVNQSRKQVKSATSSQRKHDDVPYLDLKLSQSHDELEQLRKAAKEVREEMNIEYLGASNLTKGKENITKCRNKKQEFIEQAILQDQANRMKHSEEKAAINDTSFHFGQHQPFDAKAKKRDELFNTKSMVTGVDDDLSKRFRFSARVLTLNGRDAQRRLDGFFFMVDNTLTLYEFRQFGTRASVLPFVKRGVYNQLTGNRKHKSYHLLDIQTGKNLTFLTSSQPSLPDSLKSKQTVTFRIISTGDEETRTRLLYHGCRTSKQKEDMKKFIDSYLRQEMDSGTLALRKIQATIRSSMVSRGTKMMTSLFHYFKTLDKSGDGILNPNEIQNAFQKFHIQISKQDFDQVWKIIDENNDGSLDYGEFVRGFFGEMNETRKNWVRRAFQKLDPSATGTGDAANLYKFFCPSKHPSVIKGEMTEANLLAFFEEIFQITKRKREIPYTIFEAFYEGVSIQIGDDDEFVAMLKNTWTM